MHLDQVMFRLGGQDITAVEILIGGGALALVLLVAAVALAWRGQRGRREETFEAMRRAGELEIRVAELSGHLKSFADQSISGQAQLTRTLDERLDHVSHRRRYGR